MPRFILDLNYWTPRTQARRMLVALRRAHHRKVGGLSGPSPAQAARMAAGGAPRPQHLTSASAPAPSGLPTTPSAPSLLAATAHMPVVATAVMPDKPDERGGAAAEPASAPAAAASEPGAQSAVWAADGDDDPLMAMPFHARPDDLVRVLSFLHALIRLFDKATQASVCGIKCLTSYVTTLL